MAANDIVIAGAIFPDVPKILLPVYGGGTAAYTDVSDTDAVAADVASGKYFYTAQGVKTEGTGSGGGGTTWETVYQGSAACTSYEDGYYYYLYNPFNETIPLNSVWRVTWNNVEYNCTATVDGTSYNLDDYIIGNPGIIGLTSSAANEPFAIARVFTNRLFIASAQSGTYSLKLEKQVSGGGGGGADCPTFTINYDDDSGDVLSASCDKTYGECIAYLTTANSSVTMSALIDSKFYADNELIFENIAGATGHLPSQTGGDINYSVPDTSDGMITAHIISFSNDGTITVTDDPVERRTSNNLAASTLTVTAPAGYYAQNATKTLTDNNLLAGNIKNGVSIFGVTGNYGGGGGTGLDYETGTYTPASNTTQPTISFSGSHSTPPVFIAMSDTSSASGITSSSNTSWSIVDYWRINGEGFPYSTSATRYAVVYYGYRSSNNTTIASIQTQYNSDNTGTDSTAYYRYWATASQFKPGSNSTSRYWRSGRTYKWIAVWK